MHVVLGARTAGPSTANHPFCAWWSLSPSASVPSRADADPASIEADDVAKLQLPSASAINLAVHHHRAADDGIFHVSTGVEELNELQGLPEANDLTADRDVIDRSRVRHPRMFVEPVPTGPSATSATGSSRTRTRRRTLTGPAEVVAGVSSGQSQSPKWVSLCGAPAAVVRGPRSDLATAIEGAASQDGPIQSKPLPVAVHLVVAQVSACADTAVLMQRFVWCGLGHALIVS